MHSENKAWSILKEVFDRFDSVFPDIIQDAYLYGSYARGDYDSESDVDILLTADVPPEKLSFYQIELSNINSDLSLLYGITVSATIKSKKQFDRYSDVLPYYRNVLHEGIRYAG